MGKVLIDTAKQEVKTKTATLEKTDLELLQDDVKEEFLPFIGLEVTCRKDVSVKTQLQMAELSTAAQTTDTGKQVELMYQLVDNLAYMVTDWNIGTNGETRPINTESLLGLGWWLYQAVNLVAAKASNSKRMDPNSKRP